MKKIKLINVDKNSNELVYRYDVSNELEKYFTNIPFKIEYPENVENVPESIACIPFICNVLPIVWITDAILEIEEIDKTFYESIEHIKKGYIEMFPETVFLGKIKVKSIIDNDYCAKKNKSALFFSGGLDSYQTLINHLDEKPVLLSVWGSDIEYDNTDGWKTVHKVIKNIAKQYNLKEAVIRSTFREFDAEGILSRDFSKQLRDNWWHGVKHGIGLLGHVAPYAWMKNISLMYIAASHSPENGIVRCASHPSIDNQVKYCGCQVVHDGFEYNRQNKITNLINFCKDRNEIIELHVCWQSQDGNNCCNCEKCYRTMAGIWAEGEDPQDFGFNNANQALKNMKIFIKNNTEMFDEMIDDYWITIQKRAIENKDLIKSKTFYKDFKWFLTVDLKNLKSLKLPLSYNIRTKLSNYWFYRKLHQLKMGIK